MAYDIAYPGLFFWATSLSMTINIEDRRATLRLDRGLVL